MHNQANFMSQIQKHKKDVSELELMKNDILRSHQKMKKKFPGHKPSMDEINLIEQKIETIQLVIKDLIQQSLTDSKPGEILDIEEVKETVLNAWGRTKVQVHEFTKDELAGELENAQNFFEDVYFKEITTDNFKLVTFSYDAKSRNDLNYVLVYLIEGFAFANLHTDKVGWSVDVTPNDKFLNLLAGEIESNS